MTVPKISQTCDDISLLGRRDAFHVPGVLVHSYQYLQPGDGVKFLDAICTLVESAGYETRDAIIDPFLPSEIPPGTLFWVFPTPELVGNLTHHFDLNVSKRPIITPSVLEEDIEEDEEIEEETSCNGCYEPYAADDEDDGSCKGCYS